MKPGSAVYVHPSFSLHQFSHFLFSFPSRKLISLLQGWLFPHQVFTQLGLLSLSQLNHFSLHHLSHFCFHSHRENWSVCFKAGYFHIRCLRSSIAFSLNQFHHFCFHSHHTNWPVCFRAISVIRRLWNNPRTLPSAFGLGCVTTL